MNPVSRDYCRASDIQALILEKTAGISWKIPAVLYIVNFKNAICDSQSVSSEEITRIDLFFYIVQCTVIAVCNDTSAHLLKFL